MCGIAGLLFAGKALSRESLRSLASQMGDALTHRGPDAEGIWAEEAQQLAFAHRRLSILDLSDTGLQPMESADKRYVITFNGEIYNFQALRTDLLAHGHTFRGTSDTEVLLAGFCQWGFEATLEKLNGMFAFGLWDRQSQKLFLARDRFGEKPLYYGSLGGRFAFASELKAIRALFPSELETNQDAVRLYLQHSYVPTPLSIYRGFHKLPPAHFVVVDRQGNASPAQCYWNVAEKAAAGRAQLYRGSFEDAQKEFEALLTDSIQLKMVADVPVGAFLSGGIDSSLVVSIMQKHSRFPVKTFTIGYQEGDFDESESAEQVARHIGTDHHCHRLNETECLQAIARVGEIYDEPFADSSQIPTYLVSRAARQKVTVALTGDGGDELFGGYPRYWRMMGLFQWLETIPNIAHLPLTGISRLLSALPAPVVRATGSRRFITRLQKVVRHLPEEQRRNLYKTVMCPWENPMIGGESILKTPTRLTSPFDNIWKKHQSLPLFDAMALTDQLTFLPDDILAKVDRASMAVSLETRVPLLDHRIAEFVWRLPEIYLMEKGGGKKLLKSSLFSRIPRSLVDRPKRGFNFPLEHWIRGGLREWAEDLLSERSLQRLDLLNPAPIRRGWKAFLEGKTQSEFQIWNLLMLQVWLSHQRNTPANALRSHAESKRAAVL